MPDTHLSSAISIKHPDRFFIGGEWVAPSGSGRFDVISPATEELVLSVAEAQAADADRAVAAGRQAFGKGPWPRMSPQERAPYIHALAAALTARNDELATIWTSQMGILNSVAKFGTPGAAGFFHYYAALADSFPFVERHEPSCGGGAGLLVREPVGVVLAIVPWNAPLMLAALKLAPALIAGCTVILKASPEAPLDAYVIAEAAEAAGLPPGVLNLVTADREVSERMVRNPGVDKVSFHRVQRRRQEDRLDLR